MKNLLILLPLLLILLPAAYGQDNNIIVENNLGDVARGIQGTGAFIKTVDTYQGTPYFTQEFLAGYLILENGAKTKTLALRYNMLNNNVEFIRDDDVFTVSGEKLKAYIIETSGNNIIFKNGFKAENNDFNSNTLMHVIYDGDIKLLAHYTSKLWKDVSTYDVAGDLNEYVTNTDFYLVTANDIIHEVKLKKSDILAVLPGKNIELQNFAEKNNLDFSEALQLKRILSHYDLLSTSKSE